jgi:hypothetical protein
VPSVRQAIGTTASAAVALALTPGRITLLIDFTAPLNWMAGLLRIALALAGALLALVFARLLFRAGTARIDDRLARLLRVHADPARAIAERPQRGDAPSALRTGLRPPRRRTWTGWRAGSVRREKSAPACPRPVGPSGAYGTI